VFSFFFSYFKISEKKFVFFSFNSVFAWKYVFFCFF
jgi:hypothetical protein